MNDEYEDEKKMFDGGQTISSMGFQMKQAMENPDNLTVNKDAQQDLTGSEDWAMSAPKVKVTKEEKLDEWKMPEPVFRVSSGKTPEKSDKAPPQDNLPFGKPVNLEKTSPDTPIQPQPNISEEFSVNKINEKSSAKAAPKSSAKIAFVIVGIIGIILFAVAFLTAVYFLFFYKPEM